MVQFQHPDSHLKRAVKSDYWKLQDHGNDKIHGLQKYLQSIGSYYKKGSLKAELAAICTRYDQGFLRYHKCSGDELVRFLYQRGIVARSRKRSHMVTALEEADDAITFTPFERLPAELRERIYSMHLEWLGIDDWGNVPPPPITETSHLIRRESLYAFRQRMVLRMGIGTEQSVQQDEDCPLLLSRMSDTDLYMTRKVLFYAFRRKDWYNKPQHIDPEFGIQFLLDVGSEKTPPAFHFVQSSLTTFWFDDPRRMRICQSRLHDERNTLSPVHEILKEKLDFVAEFMGKREEKALTRLDVEAVMQAVEIVEDTEIKGITF
jgi:hypothetical protein